MKRCSTCSPPSEGVIFPVLLGGRGFTCCFFSGFAGCTISGLVQYRENSSSTSITESWGGGGGKVRRGGIGAGLWEMTTSIQKGYGAPPFKQQGIPL